MDMSDSMLLLDFTQLPIVKIVTIPITIFLLGFAFMKLIKNPTKKWINVLLIATIIVLPLAYFSGDYFNKVMWIAPCMPSPDSKEYWDNLHLKDVLKFNSMEDIMEVIEYGLVIIVAVVVIKTKSINAK